MSRPIQSEPYEDTRSANMSPQTVWVCGICGVAALRGNPCDSTLCERLRKQDERIAALELALKEELEDCRDHEKVCETRRCARKAVGDASHSRHLA